MSHRSDRSTGEGIEVATEFIRAFNDRDLDGFVAVLHPEVRLHSMRGMRSGRAAARKWATRAPGGVQQSIRIDGMQETERLGAGVTVVALITRLWRWEEDGSFAGEDSMAWSFELGDGLVLSWKPFDRRDDALSAADLPSGSGPLPD